MKIIRLLAMLVSLLLAAPSFAATFSNNWSFVDEGTGKIVGGVVSGLVNGKNVSASGLTFTVTQSPYSALLGTYTFNFAAGAGYPADRDSYSAENGVVTMANIFYANEMGEFLVLGTHPTSGPYYPELTSYNSLERAYSHVSGVTFSAVSSAVPEPAGWMLMIGGFGLIGMAMRRRGGALRLA